MKRWKESYVSHSFSMQIDIVVWCIVVWCLNLIKKQGPVVQSIVSLTSSLFKEVNSLSVLQHYNKLY